MNFLNKHALVLTAVLVVQAGGYYALDLRRESAPPAKPLEQFPTRIAGWEMIREYPMEKEVAEVLKADDTMNRLYASGQSREAASFFVAFFRTQRAGQSPHSPKNCLPGSGWTPSATGAVRIPMADGQTITVNRYVVSRGDDRSVVLYWYHSHNRVIASEYAAKFWLVADAVRYNRSDTALVRVVVPATGSDDRRAEDTAVSFTRDVFPEVRKHFQF